MRTPADLPRRRVNRNRASLIAVVVLFFVLITSMRGIASFYTTYLWFGELHLHSVWRGVLGTKIALATIFTLIFFVLLYANLYVADRLAPRFRAIGPEDELVQRYRTTVAPHAPLLRTAVSAGFALLAGTGTAAHWNDWLLLRHSACFRIPAPQCHRDA